MHIKKTSTEYNKHQWYYPLLYQEVLQEWTVVPRIRESGTTVVLRGIYLLSNLKVPYVMGGGTFKDGQWYLVSGKVVHIVLVKRYLLSNLKVPTIMLEGIIRYGRWYLVIYGCTIHDLLRAPYSLRYWGCIMRIVTLLYEDGNHA